MSVLSISRDWGADPSIVRMVTDDSYATMTTAGYLTDEAATIATLNVGTFDWQANDVVLASYSGNATAWFNVSSDFADLTPFSDAGEVTLPTIANHIAVFTNVTGGLSEDVATAIQGGNLQAGLSGTAGYLASFPAAASKGSFRVVAAANTGDTLFTLTNAAHGQATVATIADGGSATTNIAQASSALVDGAVVLANGTAGNLQNGGFTMLAATTAAYGGGGTSNAYTATGIAATDVVSCQIRAQTNTASIVSAVPTANTLTVTFSADPGAATTVDWVAFRAVT